MYLGIDIGGTKTIVATLSETGEITASQRFPTDQDYNQFLADLSSNLQQLDLSQVKYACAGVPGLLEREKGLVISLGNLPWRNMPIHQGISEVLGDEVSLIIENDARLAALSEAQLVKDRYPVALYVTVSTGIGGGLIENGRIVKALQDTEMGKMPLWFDGEYRHWEDFAGGRGVVTAFGKKAEEITDPAQWQELAERLAAGFGPVCSTLQPAVIILGGAVGAFADKYSQQLLEILAERLHSNVRQPQEIIAAQRPNEAVIYGCYDLIKQAI